MGGLRKICGELLVKRLLVLRRDMEASPLRLRSRRIAGARGE